MEEIKAITINNIEYLIVKEIIDNLTKYVYLCNEDNPKDILIRKVVIENDDEMLVKLDSEEELRYALNLFQENEK